MTGKPRSRKNFAVPPVLMNSTLNSRTSAAANSFSPVLSETEIRARRTGTRSVILATIRDCPIVAMGTNRPRARADKVRYRRDDPARTTHPSGQCTCPTQAAHRRAHRRAGGGAVAVHAAVARDDHGLYPARRPSA